MKALDISVPSAHGVKCQKVMVQKSGSCGQSKCKLVITYQKREIAAQEEV